MKNEFINQLTDKVAETKEAFIIEQLARFVEEQEDGSLIWNESIKVRLAEIEDFKQKIKGKLIQALRIMEENKNYTPRLKDKKYRDKKSKLELEREENHRCQELIKEIIREIEL